MKPVLTRAAMTAAAAVLALGALGAASVPQRTTVRPDQLASIRAAQPALVQKAVQNLEGRRSELGIGEQGGFQVRNAFTNPRGQVVARMNQTHAGVRVWAGEAIVHVLPTGELKTQTEGVRRGIALTGEPALTADQALAVAQARFAARGPLVRPAEVEKVVFPTELTGGLALRWDAEHRPTIDRAMSVVHRPPQAAHVWAYQVTLGTMNREDGVRELRYVVDGSTGAILHVSNQVKSLASFPLTTATPAPGTGTGLYTGSVNLDTSVDENGMSWLWDQARGTAPLPFLRDMASGYGYPGATTGLMVQYQDGFNYDPIYFDNYNFYSNATASWGDGAPYQGEPTGPNGQTAAVDAQVSATKTWDMLQLMFGRNGTDGQGTSIAVVVHPLNGQTGLPYDGSFFGNNYVILGDRTDPAHPGQWMPYTEPDVVAHEMSHGVVLSTAQLDGPAYAPEGPGLHEGFCDAMGEAVEAFVYGTPTTDQWGTPLIPNDGNDFYVAARVTRGAPFRSFVKPSQDGASLDNWFEGLGMADGQYASGPLNRAFYFLARGASSHATDVSYSPYLPGGMTGAGMHSAAHIWFTMVTEYLGNYSGYTDARSAAITAAQELYGAGSQEEFAVMNAFAAINVGQAPGQAPRTHVGLPLLLDRGFLYTDRPQYRYWPIVGRGTTVTLNATVTNNDDHRIEWKTGTPFATTGTKYEGGGTIGDDGRWHVPLRMDWHGMTAVSAADPLQYAALGVFVINMDNDDDSETDAIDLGGIALGWMLGPLSGGMIPNSSANSVFYNIYWVDDEDIGFFHQGFSHAFPVPSPAAAH
jgi:Zn-dependent metalloprotease